MKAIEAADENGFRQLEFKFEHASEIGRLPPHHRDPFDRMLLAQVSVERLIFVTADRKLAAYNVPFLWA